jgi:hypothetical protein
LNFTSLGQTFRDELGFIPRNGVDIVNANLLHRFRRARRAASADPGRAAVRRFTRDAISPVIPATVGLETETVAPVVTANCRLSTVSFQTTRCSALSNVPAGASRRAGPFPWRLRVLHEEVGYDLTNARRVAPTGSFRFGEFYNGDRTGYTAGVRVRASEAGDDVQLQQGAIDLPGGGLVPHRPRRSAWMRRSARMFLNAFIRAAA